MKYFALLTTLLLIITSTLFDTTYATAIQNTQYYSGPEGGCYVIKKSKKTKKTYKSYIDRKLCSKKK